MFNIFWDRGQEGILHCSHLLGVNLNLSRGCWERMTLRIFNLFLKGDIRFRKLDAMNGFLSKRVVVWNVASFYQLFNPLFIRAVIKVFNAKACSEFCGDLELGFRFV